MKSGNLNFLESSGPLQACKGTALPFTALIEGEFKTKHNIAVLLWYFAG